MGAVGSHTLGCRVYGAALPLPPGCPSSAGAQRLAARPAQLHRPRVGLALARPGGPCCSPTAPDQLPTTAPPLTLAAHALRACSFLRALAAVRKGQGAGQGHGNLQRHAGGEREIAIRNRSALEPCAAPVCCGRACALLSAPGAAVVAGPGPPAALIGPGRSCSLLKQRQPSRHVAGAAPARRWRASSPTPSLTRRSSRPAARRGTGSRRRLCSRSSRWTEG